MPTNEVPAYDEDPAFQAFEAQETPPWRQAWTKDRPTSPTPQPLTPDEQSVLVEANLYVIDISVRRLLIDGVKLDTEEATQDGAEGLCDAAARYDSSKGAKFTTYAAYRVRGAIVDGVRTYDHLGGESRTEARVVSLLNNTRAVSIFAPVHTLGHGDTVTIEGTIADQSQPNPEDIAETNDTVAQLRTLIDLLEPRQRSVMLLTVQCLGQDAIAKALGVSISTVGRDLRKARAFLKDQVERHLF